MEESIGLTKVYSNQFPYKEILEIIAKAEKLERGKSIDKLKKIVKGYKKEIYPTKPKKLSEKALSTGETAYQRAIFSSKKTKLDTMGKVVWNDLELPVVLNKNRRRPSVDLIGTLDSNNTLVLCELKFASEKNKSNSPMYAAIELLIYYYFIQDNKGELDNQKVLHKNEEVIPFEWSNFNENSIFIVCANKTYWDYWKKRYEKRKDETVSKFVESLSLLIKIHFFSSSESEKQTYKNEWTEVSL